MNALKKSLLWLAFSGLVALAIYLWALREQPELATRMAEVPTQVQEVVAQLGGADVLVVDGPHQKHLVRLSRRRSAKRER